MLVSVVVPAYNNAATIAATIDSILVQTLQEFELVIADHASTDGTWKVLERYEGDPRVRLLRTEAGGGAARNWNRVTAEARAPLVKLVCGDDLLAPTILERQVAELERHGSAALVSCRRAIVDGKGAVVIAARGLASLRGLVPGRRAIRVTVRAGSNIFGEPACVLMRRDVLEDAGRWDGEFPYVIDEATYANVLLRGDAVVIPEVLASFRLSVSQWSVSLARQQVAQVRGFHDALAARHPGLLSRADVRLGNARAFVMSGLRRMLYVLLRSRMRIE